MFSERQFQTLFAYHWHTTQHLLAKAAELDEAELKADREHGRSIHNLFLHLLDTDFGWRTGLEGGQQPPPLAADDYPNLATLQTGFQREQQAWQALLDELSAEEIEAEVVLTSRSGQEYPFPRWRVLQHLILHGMQHHSELAHLLTKKGHSPGGIDFISFRGQ